MKNTQNRGRVLVALIPTSVALLFPFVALAQPATFAGLVTVIIDIINIIIPLIFGVIFVAMIWKVIDAWVIHGGDQAKREEGKKYALIAVVVFVVAVSAYGVVALLRESIFG